MLVCFFGNLSLLCLLVVKSSLSWINTFEHPFALKSFSGTGDVDFGSIDTLCFRLPRLFHAYFQGCNIDEPIIRRRSSVWSISARGSLSSAGSRGLTWRC